MDSSGKSARMSVTDADAGGKHQGDPLGMEAPADETQNLRGGMVEPLRVVDDADERLLLGDLGEQGERGEPNQESVGRRAGSRGRTRFQRVALGVGQAARRSSIGAQSWWRPL